MVAGGGSQQSSPAEVGHSFLHPTNTATIAELDALRRFNHCTCECRVSVVFASRFKKQANLELTDAREAVNP